MVVKTLCKGVDGNAESVCLGFLSFVLYLFTA